MAVAFHDRGILVRELRGTSADASQGLMTLVIGISAIFLMPPGPCQTANWARGKKGWFTPREEEISAFSANFLRHVRLTWGSGQPRHSR